MLFKVWSAAGLKKAVVANDLESLKFKGCLKLKLSNVTAFMEDGTEIDDEEVFHCLPEGSVIYLLQENDEKPWEAPVVTDSLIDTINEESTVSINNVSDVTNLRRLRWPSPFILCDENFSTELKEVLASGDIGWYNKSEILHNLASQILKFTDNPNSAQRKEVAQALIIKYPSLKSSLGDGTHEWCIRIYDKMREVRRQKRKLQKPDDFQNKNTKFDRNSPKVARRSRGEINWAPLPPDGEDAISIAANEDWLRMESKKVVSLQDKQAIVEKMELCFANRRKIINGSLIRIEDIKKIYPFLFTVDGLVKEFSLLMAFDIDKTILSELQNIAPKLLKLANQKKKNMPPETLSLLNDFTQTNANEYHINNSLVIGILLLPFLLAEDGDLLFKMYPQETSVEDVGYGPTTPHVVVIGSPFSSSLVFVVTEGNIVLEAVEFLQGIISLVALYYCCNVEYPDKGKKMFRFIEVELLKLQGKNIPPRKVLTLINKLKKM